MRLRLTSFLAACLLASAAQAQGNGNGSSPINEIERRVTSLESDVADLKAAIAGTRAKARAVDSTGREIGVVQGITLELVNPPLHSPVVFISVGERVVPVVVRRDGFSGVLDEGSSIFFALPDCTGPAAFPSARIRVKPALPPAKVLGPLQTLFFIDFDADPIPTFTYQSAAVGEGRCVAEADVLTMAVPVVQGPNLLEMYSPPFSIED